MGHIGLELLQRSKKCASSLALLDSDADIESNRRGSCEGV